VSDDLMATIGQIDSRIERHLGLAKQEHAIRPVNPTAYYMALDAEVAGDHKPMHGYLKQYAVPVTETLLRAIERTGKVGGTAERNRRG
jgi:hypothetical protein